VYNVLIRNPNNLNTFSSILTTDASSGVTDAGKLIVKGLDGKLDSSLYNGLILNGLTSPTQSLSIAYTGTVPTWNSSGSTHTLNLPMASDSGVEAGLLSKTDYDIFAGKQAHDLDLDAIAALSGTSGLLRKTGTNTWTLDTSTQGITLGSTFIALGATTTALTGLTSLDTDAAGTLGIGGTNASIVNIATASTSQTVNIGTGSGATVINLGGAGDTVNIAGTLAYVNTTNLTVSDKLVTLNKGGASASGDASGIEIEENSAISAFVKIGNTRSSWTFSTPTKSGTVWITPSAGAFSTELLSSSTASRTLTLPDATGTLALNTVFTGTTVGLVPSGGTSSTYLRGDGIWSVVASGAAATTVNITQTAHGFPIGSWLRYSGSAYVMAMADNVANAEVIGVVSAVIDANNFTLSTNGVISGLSGLTAGQTYYLSPVAAGQITATEPTSIGQISKPCLVATSSSSGTITNLRGIIISGPAASSGPTYQQIIGDGVSTTITISHNLNTMLCNVTVWELTGNKLKIDSGLEIRYIDANKVTLIFTVAPALNSLQVLVFSSGGTGIVTNAYSLYNPDMVPGAPSAYDDEFNGTVLDPKWTTVNWGSILVKNVNSTASSCLYMQSANTGRTISCILQAIPAGDFTIYTKATLNNNSSGDCQVGLILSTTNTTATGSQFVMMNNSTSTYTSPWTNFNTFGVWTTVATNGPISYFRYRRSGTTYYAGWSNNGIIWGESIVTPGFTPGYFGLYLACNQAGTVFASYDFFRYYNYSSAVLGGNQTFSSNVSTSIPSGLSNLMYSTYQGL
jgi:hypothetical protein